jgi:endo-1,4-beta-xylanase
MNIAANLISKPSVHSASAIALRIMASVCFCLLSPILFSPIVSGQISTAESAASPTLRDAGDRHHVIIGAAVMSKLLSEADYSTILSSEFSQLQPENEMKFGVIHPRPDSDPQPYDFAGADALVAFAQSHNMLVRGHTLLWHRQLPEWLAQGNYTPSQLATILQDHITKVMGHYASKVYAWDVVNEAFNDDGNMRSTLWYDEPGIGSGAGTRYIEQALRWARKADPKAKLFYNDYDADEINAKSNAIYAMAKDFKKRHVPLDGIGFQAHLSPTFDDPARLDSFARNMKRFAKLGLEIHLTEIDVRLADNTPASLSEQAKLYGEITHLCVQQPHCKLLQTWGLTDKHSWIPQFYPGQGWALLWDENYRKKPAYQAVHDGLGK